MLAAQPGHAERGVAMAITAWLATTWRQRTINGATNNTAPVALGDEWEEIGNTACLNLPPSPNVAFYKRPNLADKAALDALDATPGVVVLSAVNDDGTKVTSYLRPQDSPTGPQLVTARNRLQAAGIPTGFLTANITVGMTLMQVCDVLRAYARDLTKP